MGPFLRLVASLFFAKRFPRIFRLGLMYKLAKRYLGNSRPAPAHARSRH